MDLGLSGISSIFGENLLNINQKKENQTIDDIFQTYLNNQIEEEKNAPKTEGIFETLKTMNHEQVNANNLMTDVITGKSEDTHGALIALEQATTKMEIAVKVRDEVIQSYDKLINIQI